MHSSDTTVTATDDVNFKLKLRLCELGNGVYPNCRWPPTQFGLDAKDRPASTMQKEHSVSHAAAQ